jgi:hypothetical protein
MEIFLLKEYVLCAYSFDWHFMHAMR